jgi:hypothetical protein
MARNKFGLDFDGFLDLARKVDEMGGDALKRATENALEKSADYANGQVIEAMNNSPYSFIAGKHYSTGRSKKSAEDVAKKPLEWEGTVAKEYVGVSWKDAPQVTYLSSGTPHLKGDTRLKNAVRVKGKVRKEVSRIQQEEFQKVIAEAME